MACLTKEQRQRAQLARDDISKARHWINGFNAARCKPGEFITGSLSVNGLRLAQILLDDLLK